MFIPKLSFSVHSSVYSPTAPSKGPTVRTKKVGKNEAVLEWDHLPVDVQNGFIRNYSISYRTSVGKEMGNKIVEPLRMLLKLFLKFLNTCSSHSVFDSVEHP